MEAQTKFMKFKQAVMFDGKKYGVGMHHVSLKLMEDKFFQHMMKHGLIMDADESKELKQEAVYERNARLAKQLAEQALIDKSIKPGDQGVEIDALRAEAKKEEPVKHKQKK